MEGRDRLGEFLQFRSVLPITFCILVLYNLSHFLSPVYSDVPDYAYVCNSEA